MCRTALELLWTCSSNTQLQYTYIDAHMFSKLACAGSHLVGTLRTQRENRTRMIFPRGSSLSPAPAPVRFPHHFSLTLNIAILKPETGLFEG